jgi:hypothetical protein
VSSFDLYNENSLLIYFSGTILYLWRMVLTLSSNCLNESPLDTCTSILWKTHLSSTMRMEALTSQTSTIGSFYLVVYLRTSSPP